MPRGDGTGPMGLGPMTGRRAGLCAGVAAPGYSNTVGSAAGFGCGCGFRKMFNAAGRPGWARSGYRAYTGAYDAVTGEKEFLGKQAEYLENQLKQIKKRLSDFEENAD